jgi:hypothetical protein
MPASSAGVLDAPAGFRLAGRWSLTGRAAPVGTRRTGLRWPRCCSGGWPDVDHEPHAAERARWREDAAEESRLDALERRLRVLEERTGLVPPPPAPGLADLEDAHHQLVAALVTAQRLLVDGDTAGAFAVIDRPTAQFCAIVVEVGFSTDPDARSLVAIDGRVHRAATEAGGVRRNLKDVAERGLPVGPTARRLGALVVAVTATNFPFAGAGVGGR